MDYLSSIFGHAKPEPTFFESVVETVGNAATTPVVSTCAALAAGAFAFVKSSGEPMRKLAVGTLSAIGTGLLAQSFSEEGATPANMLLLAGAAGIALCVNKFWKGNQSSSTPENEQKIKIYNTDCPSCRQSDILPPGTQEASSSGNVLVLNCGHVMHLTCYDNARKNGLGNTCWQDRSDIDQTKIPPISLKLKADVAWEEGYEAAPELSEEWGRQAAYPILLVGMAASSVILEGGAIPGLVRSGIIWVLPSVIGSFQRARASENETSDEKIGAIMHINTPIVGIFYDAIMNALYDGLNKNNERICSNHPILCTIFPRPEPYETNTYFLTTVATCMFVGAGLLCKYLVPQTSNSYYINNIRGAATTVGFYYAASALGDEAAPLFLVGAAAATIFNLSDYIKDATGAAGAFLGKTQVGRTVCAAVESTKTIASHFLDRI